MARTYDAKKIACIVGGVMLSGFNDGDVVTVERNEDTFTFQPDTDGGGTRSKSNNKSGRFTFVLSQTSAANGLLTAIAKLDEVGNAGAVPVIVKDLNGSSLYTATMAWLVKPPVGEYKRESGGREWVFETDCLEWVEGGNA
jgi:hypothetical protein